LEWLVNEEGRYVVTVAMNAGGRDKAPVLMAALKRKRKLTNLLIVSSETAAALLGRPGQSGPSNPPTRSLSRA
jgi:hypothetical protein